MTINDLSKEDAIRLVEWFDNPVFEKIVKPLIEGEQDMLVRILLGSVDHERDARVKGRIEALTDFVAWRNAAFEASTEKST